MVRCKDPGLWRRPRVGALPSHRLARPPDPGLKRFPGRLHLLRPVPRPGDPRIHRPRRHLHPPALPREQGDLSATEVDPGAPGRRLLGLPDPSAISLSIALAAHHHLPSRACPPRPRLQPPRGPARGGPEHVPRPEALVSLPPEEQCDLVPHGHPVHCGEQGLPLRGCQVLVGPEGGLGLGRRQGVAKVVSKVLVLRGAGLHHEGLTLPDVLRGGAGPIGEPAFHRAARFIGEAKGRVLLLPRRRHKSASVKGGVARQRQVPFRGLAGEGKGGHGVPRAGA